MYNNGYGYTPYINQRFNNMVQPQVEQPIQQTTQQQYTPVQQKPMLNGKVVESIDVVKVMDINFDGSINYYPIADGSAIVTKQLQMDGTSKTIIYKPVDTDKVEQPKYATMEDVKNSINEIDLSDIEDLKDDIKEIRQEIKDMKKKKKED